MLLFLSMLKRVLKRACLLGSRQAVATDFESCGIVITPKARFPLAELTSRQHGPSTRLVETRARQGNGNRSPVNLGRQLG